MTISSDRTTYQNALLSGVIEVGQSQNGVYRAVDTALVFVDSVELETTKHVMKAFQIIPGILETLLEFRQNGKLQRPFTSLVSFIRDLVVELEVATVFGLIGSYPSDEYESEVRLASDLASVMHIIAMAFVAYHAGRRLLRTRQRSAFPSLTQREIIQIKKESYLSLATASSKIAQQSFVLFHTDYLRIYKILTLLFNVCAITFCVVSSTAMRDYYKSV